MQITQNRNSCYVKHVKSCNTNLNIFTVFCHESVDHFDKENLMTFRKLKAKEDYVRSNLKLINI